jgi:ribonuclease HI
VLFLVFAFDVIWSLPLRDVVFDCQMSEYSLPYIGFADGASRSTRNLASAAWAIYAPTNELISLRGVCLGWATNNIAEYSIVIELLVDAISLGIRRLVVRLDSQLVVLQLSNVYSIRSPTLLRVYLRIRLLERHFDHIEYQHIPRSLNTLTDALANYVLDRHLNHL